MIPQQQQLLELQGVTGYSLLKVRITLLSHTCKTSHANSCEIIFNNLFSTLQWVAMKRYFIPRYLYAISHRNLQKSLIFINVDQVRSRKLRSLVVE